MEIFARSSKNGFENTAVMKQVNTQYQVTKMVDQWF